MPPLRVVVAVLAVAAPLALPLLAQDCDPAELFAAATGSPAPSELASTIVTADFNGDGFADVAIEDGMGVGFVSVLLGDGAGGFAPARSYPLVLSTPAGLSVGDVNNDGAIDLACGDLDGPDDVVVLLGGGDGTFGLPIHRVPLGIERCFQTALADLDGDGNLDLVASDLANARLLVAGGNGDGSFAPATPLPTGPVPSFFTVGDADADGNLDLLVGVRGLGAVGVIKGDGAGGFFPERRFAAGPDPHRPALADVDADGVMDIVVASFADGEVVSVLLGIDGLEYQPPAHYAVGERPRHAHVADFTGDVVLDIAVANVFGDDLSLLVGVGDGTFAQQARFATDRSPVDIAAVDANGDTARDLVVLTTRGPQAITAFLNTCVSAPCRADLDGDGQLTIFDFLAFQNLFDAGDPRADFDGDGALTLFDFIAFQNAFDAGCP
ncbi:MAG: FG-GAP-like repeat-containing protein [Phycisphaerales bacterium JB060]